MSTTLLGPQLFIWRVSNYCCGRFKRAFFFGKLHRKNKSCFYYKIWKVGDNRSVFNFLLKINVFLWVKSRSFHENINVVKRMFWFVFNIYIASSWYHILISHILQKHIKENIMLDAVGCKDFLSSEIVLIGKNRR